MKFISYWRSYVSASEQTSPFKAAFTSAAVPVNAIVASAGPSPAQQTQPKPNPVVPLRLSVPWLTDSVTSSLPPTVSARSTSLTESALPPPVENVFDVSSFVACATGTTFTGASLTALTVIATVSVSLSAPPEPVLP